MNQKDVSLAHLKALLEKQGVGCQCLGQCYWCGRHEGDKPPHKSDCVYVAAQEHVVRINDAIRSEALKSQPSQEQVRYSDPVDRWMKS